MNERSRLPDNRILRKLDRELLVADIDNTNDPIAIYDIAYRLIRVNPSFANLFAISPAKLIGEKCYELIYGRTSKCELCHAGEVFRTNKAQMWEERRRLPDGSLHFFKVFTTPIWDRNHPTSLAMMRRVDISEQKRLADQWKNDQKKYKTIVEMAREGIFVMDIEDLLSYVNCQFIDMFGYVEEEIIGRSIFDFMYRKSYPAANIQRTSEGLVDVDEICFVKKDGSHFVSKMTLTTVNDKVGFVGTVGTVSDITHLKKIEKELRVTKEFNENIINSITDSLIIVDPGTFKILQANNHFLEQTYLNARQILSKTCFECIYGRTSPCEVYGMRCPVRQTAISKKPAFMDQPHMCGDGIKRIYSISTYPIHDIHQKLTHVVLLRRDVSKERKVEETLELRTCEVEKAHRQIKTLFETSGQLTAIGSLPELVSHVLKISSSICTNSESGIFIFDSSREHFVSLDCINSLQVSQLHSDKKGCQEEILKGFIRYVRDIEATRIYSSKDLNSPPELDFLNDIHSNWLGIPIMMKRTCIGFFLVVSPRMLDYSTDDQFFLQTLLAHVGGHIRYLMLHETEIKLLRQQVEERSSYDKIIGMSSLMQKVYDMIELVASSDSTVLISGESGTGKELVAKAIHHKSQRHEGPFVVAHCAGFADSLVESEIFGHDKGAFTGALASKKGRIERAHGGTLFLDEVGEISISTQILLLRFLQDHEFERVGGEEAINVDVRVIAATKRDLQEEILSGRFRSDFYYRLNVVSIELPPLRKRKVDIPLLVKYFLKRYNRQEAGRNHKISSEIMNIFMDYDWPGNVRQLENAVHHAVIMSNYEEIEKVHLPKYLRQEDKKQPSNSLIENEKQLVKRVLYESKWNKHEAAKNLGISRSTLYSKISRYKLVPPVGNA